MQRRTWVALAALAASAFATPAAFAQAKDIKIAHIYSRTGPLEAYGKQTQTGLMMGLDYATGGTMTVNGQKIVVIEKDDQGKPDLGKSLLAAAYSDDKVDLAVGPTSSGVALAMLPVAEEYKKILLVEPAVADSITGDKWNKYIFRTGRNSSQDAISNAVALDKPGTTIATLAQDYAFGRDGVKAFKDVDQEGQDRPRGIPAADHHRLHGRRPAPDRQAQGPAGPQGHLDGLGRRRQPVQDRRPRPEEALRHRDRHRRQHPAGHGGLQAASPAWKARATTTSASPKNPVNEGWWPTTTSEFKTPPDFFTAGGFSAAMAVVTALKKTNGDTNTNKLIAAMEGMSFDTPKGKMTFRKEDHQAMQSMYHFKIKVDPALAWARADLHLVQRDQAVRDEHPDPQQALSARIP